MEIRKKALDSFDDKRYYFSPFFSLPFHHPDIKKYEDLKKEGQDVSMYEDSKPPHFIPPYFWMKFGENVKNRKYVDARGPLFEDFDANPRNDEVLQSIFHSSFEKLAPEESTTYTGEPVPKARVPTEKETDTLIEDGIIFDPIQLTQEERVIRDHQGEIQEILPIFTFKNGQWEEVKDPKSPKSSKESQHVNDGNDDNSQQPGCSFWPRNEFESVLKKYDKDGICQKFERLSKRPFTIASSDEDDDDDILSDASNYVDDYKALKRRKRDCRIDNAFGFVTREIDDSGDDVDSVDEA